MWEIQCDSNMEESLEITPAMVPQPFRFEPEAQSQFQQQSSETSSGSSVGSDTESRDDGEMEVEQDMSWCQCGNCIFMPTARENICCHHYEAVKQKFSPSLKCVVLHEGLVGNCLNRHVLEASFYEYLEVEGPIGDEEEVNGMYQYLAYRRFVYWIWRRLWKRIRKVLPSCVVTAIRANFPSAQHIGYRDPQ